MPEVRDRAQPPRDRHVARDRQQHGKRPRAVGKRSGLSWPLPEGLDDAGLEAALFPAPLPSRVPRPEPDWGHVHRELQRHKGVTLQLLWLEYRTVHPNGHQYSWFCERYRA